MLATEPILVMSMPRLWLDFGSLSVRADQYDMDPVVFDMPW